MTPTTGPNTSSQEMRISGLTPSSTVGCIICPSRSPPATSVAPPLTASVTQPCTRSASDWRIIGPILLSACRGLPVLIESTSALKASTKSAYASLCASTRCVEMQT